MDIKISIVIPTFNSQKFLGYTLSSIKDHVDEIIIIDMSSTDNTKDIVETFEDSKIHFHSLTEFIKEEKDSNLDSSIICGLRLTTGNIVARVDDDWVWGPEIKELRKFCKEGLESHKRGLMCFVYNMISTDKYFFPTFRRPTFMFRCERNPLRTFGSFRTDNNVICHMDETKGGDVLFRRSSYLRTPFRLGHWKFLKDTQKDFVRKWIMFCGGTEEEALAKWHKFQTQPTEEIPEELVSLFYDCGKRFIPLGGFDIEKAIGKEIYRKKKFEHETKKKAKAEWRAWDPMI